MTYPTRAPRPPRAAAACVALAALTALLAGSAMAETSPWYVGASISLRQEDNLLRLADGQTAPAGFSKSDRITSTSLLAGLDQPIGRQRLTGNAVLRDNRHADNGLYDNQGYSATLGLDWSTVQRLSGTLVASASRNLSSFNLQEIGLLPQKNLESVQTLDAVARLGLVTRYSVELAAGTRRVKNSLDSPAVQARDYSQDMASLGLRWRPSGASSFGLALRGTQGRYPRFRLGSAGYEADRFDRRDIDFSATLQPTGASSLDARLSWGRTAYDLATQRSFSGVTGSLGWVWVPTGKIRLDTRLLRDTGQESYAVTTIFGTPGANDYSRIGTTLRMRADYELTAKVSFNLILSWADRELVRTQPGFLGSRPASGRERYTTMALGVRWVPHRSTTLGCDIGNERRDGSGELGSDLQARQFGCFAQFLLQ